MRTCSTNMLLREVFELPNIFTVSEYRVYFWEMKIMSLFMFISLKERRFLTLPEDFMKGILDSQAPCWRH